MSEKIVVKTISDVYRTVTKSELYDVLTELGYKFRVPKSQSTDRINRLFRDAKAGPVVIGATKKSGKLDLSNSITLLEKDPRIIVTNKKTGESLIGTDRALLLRELGVKRITKTPANTIRSSVGKITITDINTLNTEIEYMVRCSIRFWFSENSVLEHIPAFSSKAADIYPNIESIVNSGSYTTANNWEIESLSITPRVPTDLSVMPRARQQINSSSPRVINIYGDDIILNASEKNCVYNALVNQFCAGKNKISKTQIDKKYGQEDWNMIKLQRFCNDYRIKLRAYNIHNKLILDNDTILNDSYIENEAIETETKSYIRNLNCLIYDNHLYLLKNKLLSKINPIRDFVHVSKDAVQKMIAESEPTYVRMDSTGISECIYGNTHFHTNESIAEIEECYQILKAYGLADNCTYKTKYSSIIPLIEKLYNLNGKLDSFFPVDFHKSGFNYVSSKIDAHFDTTNYDMNFSYPSTLMKLPFLITCDYAYHHAKKYDNEPIINHYLYIVTPKVSSLLLPHTSVYSGEHIKYCTDKVEFTIDEVIEANSQPNYYTKILDDASKILTRDQFKKIFNRMIGLMFSKPSQKINYKYEYSHTANYEESQLFLLQNSTNYIEKISRDRYICFSKKEYSPSFINKSPIYIQILDYSRVRMYEKMKYITERYNCNILQIKTDCFTVDQIIEDPIECTEWKKIGFLPMKYKSDIVDDHPVSFFSGNNNNILYDCYAGVGKSYFIQNTIIPNLLSENKEYIVLTPTHSSLVDYKNKVFNTKLARTYTDFDYNCADSTKVELYTKTESVDINCDILHKYTFTHTIPKESTIIIDEIGLIDNPNYLYALMNSGKKIIAFGDYRQLLPIGSDRPYNAPQFINAIFGKISTDLNTNRRNNFEFSFYDDVIADRFSSKTVINKYCDTDLKDYSSEDICICKTNAECEKINKQIMTELFGTEEFCVGCKVECRTNTLRDIDIFNHYTFTITAMNEKTVTLDNYGSRDATQYIEITRKQLMNNFKPAYAITLHSAQGKSYKRVRYMSENMDLSGRELYTLISRIKNK
jgi:hypothetical protein